MSGPTSEECVDEGEGGVGGVASGMTSDPCSLLDELTGERDSEILSGTIITSTLHHT